MDREETVDEDEGRSGESPSQRFRRLAEKRVVRTIKDIRLISNLSNRNNYDYGKEEIDKIFRVLDRELRLARNKFESKQRNSDDVDFKL
ncbi:MULTISPECIES: hypothetical protein [unclassified Bradyrhizobium]|uniref:hypothetical protein n=1 Tax=unclassified Bradyrhizobium TaxID=2631580 RepID=UPI0028E6D24C|nr:MULTISPECIES: hypothetical protein [unclassified Bradyrhizobium]